MSTTISIILLENILGLGRLGDTVKVKPGYARNFLFPQGKAVQDTPSQRKALEGKLKKLKEKFAKTLAEAESCRKAIEKLDMPLVIALKATEEGKLFGSVNASDIVNLLKSHAITIDKKMVVFKNDANIQMLGEYVLEIRLHEEVRCSLTLSVVSDCD